MTTGMRSPLFIVGFPRSGTTLLRALLSAHPDVHLVNEPDLIFGIQTAGFEIEDQFTSADRARLLQQLNRQRSCQRHLATLPAEHLRDFVRCSDKQSFREVFEYLLPKPEEFAVWGTKSLPDAFAIPALQRLYPESLFVHLVRDPRAALLSSYRKRFARGADRRPPFQKRIVAFFAYEAMLWCEFQRAVQDALGSLGNQRVLELRYEDLVRQPDLQLMRVCASLGLPFDPAMLDESIRRDDPILTSDLAYAHRRLAQPIDPERAWTGHQLPTWAGRLIERFAGESMLHKGYTITPGGMNVLWPVVCAGLKWYEPSLCERLTAEVARLSCLRKPAPMLSPNPMTYRIDQSAGRPAPTIVPPAPVSQ